MMAETEKHVVPNSCTASAAGTAIRQEQQLVTRGPYKRYLRDTSIIIPKARREKKRLVGLGETGGLPTTAMTAMGGTAIPDSKSSSSDMSEDDSDSDGDTETIPTRQ